MAVKRFIYYTIIVLLSISFGCSDDYVVDAYEDEELTIARYLESNSDYSELVNAMKRTQYFTILSLQGAYTVLAPKNEAFVRYYAQKGVSGLEQLDDETVNHLVGTLVIDSKITSVYFRMGRLAYPLSGESLVMSFGTSGLSSAKVNGVPIKAFDMIRSNGVLHEMEDVITPADKNLAELLQEDASFSIFYEALVATGVIDTLKTMEPEYKNAFTLFVPSNEAFVLAGLNNLEDLKLTYSNTDDVTNPEDSLNQYMRYHILNEDLMLLEFENGIYNTLMNYPIKVDINDQFRINSTIDDEGGEISAVVDVEHINQLAWNGIMHRLNKIIPAIELKAEPVLHIGSDVLISADELDMNKVIYAGDATTPWITGDSEVWQYHCKNPGDYLEFYSPYLFPSTYKVYYEASSYDPGRTILGLYVNDVMVGEPFINNYESIDLSKGNKGFYVGKVNIRQGGPQRIKVKVEGAYLYPDDNFIRLKKIYFEPAN